MTGSCPAVAFLHSSCCSGWHQLYSPSMGFSIFSAGECWCGSGLWSIPSTWIQLDHFCRVDHFCRALPRQFSRAFQALAARSTENTKKAFEDSVSTFEQIMNAKSAEQVVEIQSQYLRRAYDNFVAEVSKFGE